MSDEKKTEDRLTYGGATTHEGDGSTHQRLGTASAASLGDASDAAAEALAKAEAEED